MHTKLVYAAYGFLALSGIMHFVIDVLSQYLRGKRAPSAETTLYWGMNSAFALGPLLLGTIGLLLLRRAPEIVDEWPMTVITACALVGWFTIVVLFVEYKEPRYALGLFAALFIAAVATR